MNIRNMLVLGMLAIICMTHAWAANPNLAGDSTDVVVSSGTLTTVSSVASVTNVANVAAGTVQSNAMSHGFVGGTAISVTTSTAVSVGTLTAGTKRMQISVTDTVNYGAADVVTGTGMAVMTATGSPYFFDVSTTTPIFYMIGNAGAATAQVNHIK